MSQKGQVPVRMCIGCRAKRKKEEMKRKIVILAITVFLISLAVSAGVPAMAINNFVPDDSSTRVYVNEVNPVLFYDDFDDENPVALPVSGCTGIFGYSYDQYSYCDCLTVPIPAQSADPYEPKIDMEV